MITKRLFRFSFFVSALFINCINCIDIEAQISLQMEEYGKSSVQKFSIGTELTFLVAGDEHWRTEFIEDLIPEKDIIVFTNGYVNVKDIVALRSCQIGKTSKIIAYNLYTFGAGWGIYSIIGSIFTDDASLDLRTAIIVGTSGLLGFLIEKIFKHKTYRMGKRRKLRILDMRIEPVIKP